MKINDTYYHIENNSKMKNRNRKQQTKNSRENSNKQTTKQITKQIKALREFKYSYRGDNPE